MQRHTPLLARSEQSIHIRAEGNESHCFPAKVNKKDKSDAANRRQRVDTRTCSDDFDGMKMQVILERIYKLLRRLHG